MDDIQKFEKLKEYRSERNTLLIEKKDLEDEIENKKHTVKALIKKIADLEAKIARLKGKS